MHKLKSDKYCQAVRNRKDFIGFVTGKNKAEIKQKAKLINLKPFGNLIPK